MFAEVFLDAEHLLGNLHQFARLSRLTGSGFFAKSSSTISEMTGSTVVSAAKHQRTTSACFCGSASCPAWAASIRMRPRPPENLQLTRHDARLIGRDEPRSAEAPSRAATTVASCSRELPLSNLIGSHGFADREAVVSRDEGYLRYVERGAQAAIAADELSGEVGGKARGYAAAAQLGLADPQPRSPRRRCGRATRKTPSSTSPVA